MKEYRVNGIFYSLQGEGHNTGRAAVFVRFAGCNLRCPFCDTEFDTFREMTAEQILDAVVSASIPLPTAPSQGQSAPAPPPVVLSPRQSAVGGFPADTPPLIVLTGGEPTLQVDEALVDLFHQHGYHVAMESNGTRPAPRNLDWLTVSPKSGEWCWVSGEWRMPDELKIVFDEDTPAKLSSLSTIHHPLSTIHHPLSTIHHPLSTIHPSPLLYLQPCDTGDAVRNAAIVQQCVDYIKRHPQWRLSLQTHKLIGIE